MPYVVEKYINGKTYRYWQPKKKYLLGGQWVECPFKTVKLTDDWVIESSQLNEKLQKWRNGFEVKEHPGKGTIGWLIERYKTDEEFIKLRDTTKRSYSSDMNIIANTLWDVPLECLTRQDAKAFCKSFSQNKRKPSAIAGMGRILYNYARDITDIKENPFENLRIAKAAAREEIWTVENIEILKAKAIEMGRPSIALTAQLAFDTGQRPGDLRLLPWNRYIDGKIRLRQSKTGVWVQVRVMKELAAMLSKTPRTSPMVLVCEETGKPYSKDMLSRRFRETCEAAGIDKSLQLRDLRRTAVVRLAENGCELPEICGITGHTLTSATEILKVYLPTNSKMAENAVQKLEKHQIT